MGMGVGGMGKGSICMGGAWEVGSMGKGVCARGVGGMGKGGMCMGVGGMGQGSMCMGVGQLFRHQIKSCTLCCT